MNLYNGTMKIYIKGNNFFYFVAMRCCIWKEDKAVNKLCCRS